ncbi:MAG TPA: EFR1 family ferrodoxin [Candidatus Limiplasma sp.]|nr:EFR1 family ferrodoxin [Candidatus Limiplasma sp.]HPS81197.1 EFR1 family ferrodoxin [Candidatus Limiplasma sp.]
MLTVRSSHIVYFSGTGGTARVARAFQAALDSRGISTALTELNGPPYPAVNADLLVLLYPVYAANAPQPVREWLAVAPAGEGRCAAVLSVSGGGEVSPNTACRVYPARRLAQKGYRVLWDSMLVMPSNFMIPYSDALCALLLREAPRRAEQIVGNLLAGNVRRSHPLLWDRMLTRLLGIERFGSRMFGKQLRAGDRCNGCGWCARHCPRGNITLKADRPVFGDRCVLCTRCLYGCPTNAITPGFGKFALLRDGFNLDAIEARTAQTDDFPSVEALTHGIAMNGVRKYLNEAKGAPANGQTNQV